MSHAQLLVRVTPLLLAVLLGASCRQAQVQNTPTRASVDSLDGVIVIAGTEFDHKLVLKGSGSNVALIPGSREDSAALARLAGLEVRVRSIKPANSSVHVASFLALRAGTSDVIDGIVQEEHGKLLLKTSTAVYALGNPPTALWQLKGARVWIGGPLDTGPNTYGLIAPARLP